MTEIPDGCDPAKTILLDWQRVCCPGHGEHLRPHVGPPEYKHMAQVMHQCIKLMQAVLADQRPDSLWAAADEFCRGKPGPPEINRVTEKRPLCYFATRDQMRTFLLDSEIMVIGRCDNCGLSGMGGPYQISLPMGIQTRWFCVECALTTGENMHKAYPEGNTWPTVPK